MRKNILYIFIASIVLLSCSAVKINKNELDSMNASSTTVKDVNHYGQLSLNENKLVGKDGQSVILRGVSLGWHNWWPKYFSSESVKWLTNDWKCNIIRIPIGIEPSKGYLQNPQEALKRLDIVANAAIQNNIYFIADWHAHELHLDQSVAFFDKVSKKYAQYPNIIYEIFNEPINIEWKEIKAYAIKVIQTIRKNDPKNLIIVGTPQWSQDVDIVAEDPILGYENIMYTLHFYANTHKKSLRDKADKAIAKGLPIFVTECGSTAADGKGGYNFEEWNIWREWMEKNKISWLVWGVFDKNEDTALLQPNTGISEWKQSQLTEWGRLAKEKIKDSNTQP